MKLEKCDGVMNKHRAQTRFYEETKDLILKHWRGTINASLPPHVSGRPNYAHTYTPLTHPRHDRGVLFPCYWEQFKKNQFSTLKLTPVTIRPQVPVTES